MKCAPLPVKTANTDGAMDEEEAFSVLSTNELVAAGYIDAATMDELCATWSEEIEALPMAA